MRLRRESVVFRNLAKCNKNRHDCLFNLCFRAMDTQTQITYKPKKVSLQIADEIRTVKNKELLNNFLLQFYKLNKQFGAMERQYWLLLKNKTNQSFLALPEEIFHKSTQPYFFAII